MDLRVLTAETRESFGNSRGSVHLPSGHCLSSIWLLIPSQDPLMSPQSFVRKDRVTSGRRIQSEKNVLSRRDRETRHFLGRQP